MTDEVNEPSHYNQNGIEVIDVIETYAKSDFRLANVIKYVCRCEYKGNKLQDLEKAQWYLERVIDELLDDKDHDDVWRNETSSFCGVDRTDTPVGALRGLTFDNIIIDDPDRTAFEKMLYEDVENLHDTIDKLASDTPVGPWKVGDRVAHNFAHQKGGTVTRQSALTTGEHSWSNCMVKWDTETFGVDHAHTCETLQRFEFDDEPETGREIVETYIHTAPDRIAGDDAAATRAKDSYYGFDRFAIQGHCAHCDKEIRLTDTHVTADDFEKGVIFCTFACTNKLREWQKGLAAFDGGSRWGDKRP